MGATSSKNLDLPTKDLNEVFEKLKSAHFFDKLEAFEKDFEGTLITPDKVELYTPARCRAFNHDMRGYPLVIAQVKTVSDIVKCVNFVRDFGNGIKFCVCSGGHSNRCMADDAFVVDLLTMNAVTLHDKDPDNLAVTVEGGAYLEEVDKLLAPLNYGMVAGSYPKTGIGGWTLAGGFGWLARMYGLGVDNLLEIEVVLATGQVVVANDQNEHAALIVGCRGGGGNFGIVSKFKFRVYPLPKHCYHGAKVFMCPTLASAADVLKRADTLYADAPNNVSTLLVLPAGAPVVPSLWSCFSDEDNIRNIPILSQASRLGGWFTLEDSVKPASYHFDVQTATSKQIFSGHLYTTLAQVGHFNEKLPDEFFTELLTHTRKSKPSTLEDAVVILFPMGGVVMTGVAGVDTMVSPEVRNLKYFGIIEVRWRASAGDAGRNDARAWAKEAHRIMSKYSPVRMRHTEDAINAEQLREADVRSPDVGYDESTLTRLREIKATYDPANLFNMNVNIDPASS